METAFAPPVGLLAAAGVLAALFAAILPTCLYLYVESRGRRQWARAGDTVTTRRAPGIVRLTGWLSFALGQVALPWLLVPVWCAVLLYLQARSGLGRPTGMAVTAGLGAAALVQSILAVRLLPLGVRLLARDARLGARLAGRARLHAIPSATILGGGMLLGWAMDAIPSFVHPWLAATLAWTALRPVMAYAAVCLLHALLLGRCVRAVVAGDGPRDGRESR